MSTCDTDRTKHKTDVRSSYRWTNSVKSTYWRQSAGMTDRHWWKSFRLLRVNGKCVWFACCR